MIVIQNQANWIGKCIRLVNCFLNKPFSPYWLGSNYGKALSDTMQIYLIIKQVNATIREALVEDDPHKNCSVYGLNSSDRHQDVLEQNGNTDRQTLQIQAPTFFQLESPESFFFLSHG